MKLLLDTHVALWSALQPSLLRPPVQDMLLAPENTLLFSLASIWELSIKYALKRPDFRVDPRVLRASLLERGDTELPITSDHVFGLTALPALHRDPFDRILLSQAIYENALLLTADEVITRYPAPVLRV